MTAHPPPVSRCNADATFETPGEMTLVGESTLDGDERERHAKQDQVLRMGNPNGIQVNVGRYVECCSEYTCQV